MQRPVLPCPNNWENGRNPTFMTRLQHFKTRINFLYNGYGQIPTAFRYALLVIDLLVIAFFILASFLPDGLIEHSIDYAIAVLIICDLMARLWISKSRLKFLWEPVTIADILVIGTLIASAFVESYSFLRIVRSLRVMRSFHVLRDLRDRNAFFKKNEDIIQSVLNLSVFIFFVTALVYVFQVRTNASVTNYIDALYFTVTTLTTTGFGDITLEGTSGRLLSITIMIVGVALFLRLVQTIFRPAKVHYTCPNCGLSRHDMDAVHCKHCGRTVKIETEGA
jgi:voltage-gated potassium channel